MSQIRQAILLTAASLYQSQPPSTWMADNEPLLLYITSSNAELADKELHDQYTHRLSLRVIRDNFVRPGR